MNVSLRQAAGACAVSLLTLLPLASSASGAAAHPQQRQLAVTTLSSFLAVTTLSSFKVVLTATRIPGTSPGPMATITVVGYRHTARAAGS